MKKFDRNKNILTLGKCFIAIYLQKVASISIYVNTVMINVV